MEAGGGDLDADTRGFDRVGRLLVQPLDRLRVRPRPVVLDEVGMRERVEQSAPRRVPQPDEVAPPGFVRAELLDQPWLRVDREAVDEVDRAEQIVPRIGREDVRGLTLAAGEVVDLEPELDREPSLLRIDDRAHIAVEVVDAALEHVRLVPEPAGLHEVVDMLGEADLVDPALGGRLDEYLHRFERMLDPLLGIAKVHVVVDDQSNEATNSRSAASVTFTSLESPGTVVTRPPRASTSEAQSVAPASSPATASRSTGARNACGVWTATSSSRGSVSTICPPRTRLTVSASGNAGTAPSQPSFSAVSTRPITSSGSTGRAASWTTITAASPPTSATPARTDSARVSPPPTQALTFAQPSSSATRIEGSSQPGGATITISSIQSEASRRSRLSARSGRSRSFANAFGRSEPSRSPRPAAARTAQTLNATPLGTRPSPRPSSSSSSSGRRRRGRRRATRPPRPRPCPWRTSTRWRESSSP